MITVDDKKECCHRCGSYNLRVIGIDDDDNSLSVWCDECQEGTLDGKIKLSKIEITNLQGESV